MASGTPTEVSFSMPLIASRADPYTSPELLGMSTGMNFVFRHSFTRTSAQEPGLSISTVHTLKNS